MKTPTTEREWRCRRCGTLLGVEHEDHLQIRYKRVQLIVRGEVLSVCPRCHELNQRRTPVSSDKTLL